MRWFWGTPSSVDNHHDRADDQHGQCEFLPACEWPEIQADLRIGLANEFDQEPKQPVKGKQRPEHSSSIQILPVNPPQNKKQDESFKQSFVKLRRMPRRTSP